jgi:hypothetical protein
MFQALKLVFQALEHVYQSLELMFQALEYKIIRGEKTFSLRVGNFSPQVFLKNIKGNKSYFIFFL